MLRRGLKGDADWRIGASNNVCSPSPASVSQDENGASGENGKQESGASCHDAAASGYEQMTNPVSQDEEGGKTPMGRPKGSADWG